MLKSPRREVVVEGDQSLTYPSHLFIKSGRPFLYERCEKLAPFLAFSRHLQPRQWSSTEISYLTSAVSKQLNASFDHRENRIGASGVDDSVPANVVDTVDKLADIEWQIVASQINRLVSPSECFAHFHNSLVSQNSAWTKAEERKLLSAVLDHGEHDWVSIAEAIGRRTPIACLRQYQQTLNAKIIANTSEWTATEDRLLHDAVVRHSKVNWVSVADRIPGRTARQCATRLRNSTQIPRSPKGESLVTGRWLVEEERLLFAACLICGAPQMRDLKRNDAEYEELLQSLQMNAELASSSISCQRSSRSLQSNFAGWSAVACLVPGKNEAQCREKWVNVLDPSINPNPYTSEEDRRLKNVVMCLLHLRGSNDLMSTSEIVPWALVAEYMPGRSDHSVRTRHRVIEKHNPSQLRDVSDEEQRPSFARKRKICAAPGTTAPSNTKPHALPSKLGRTRRAKLQESDFIPILNLSASNSSRND